MRTTRKPARVLALVLAVTCAGCSISLFSTTKEEAPPPQPAPVQMNNSPPAK